jgi:hypothetical protein
MNTIAYCANKQCEKFNEERAVVLSIHSAYDTSGSPMKCTLCHNIMRFKLVKVSPFKKPRS